MLHICRYNKDTSVNLRDYSVYLMTAEAEAEAEAEAVMALTC